MKHIDCVFNQASESIGILDEQICAVTGKTITCEYDDCICDPQRLAKLREQDPEPCELLKELHSNMGYEQPYSRAMIKDCLKERGVEV